MASMNRKQRAESYLKRIKGSSNKEQEYKKILDEINGLVWSESQKPLSKEERLAIVDEIENLFNQQTIQKSEGLVVNASDNSGVIDIIGALKRGVKG